MESNPISTPPLCIASAGEAGVGSHAATTKNRQPAATIIDNAFLFISHLLLEFTLLKYLQALPYRRPPICIGRRKQLSDSLFPSKGRHHRLYLRTFRGF